MGVVNQIADLDNSSIARPRTVSDRPYNSRFPYISVVDRGLLSVLEEMGIEQSCDGDGAVSAACTAECDDEGGFALVAVERDEEVYHVLYLAVKLY